MASDPVHPPFISPDTREGKYLFLDLDPPQRPGLTLVGAGRELCTENYRIDRSSFQYHSIELVAGGTWLLEHKGRSEVLRAGALFAYGPGTAYSLTAKEGGERIKYFMNFTGGTSREWIQDCGLAECAVLYAQHPRWIHDLFDQLLDCARHDAGVSREIGNRLVELILLRIRSDARPHHDHGTEGRQTYERCRAFIHDNYLQVGNVAEIAKRCHLDPAYLARLFKRYGNERPLRFLTRLKTQHAAELIIRRGYSVAGAGRAVGFSDPYHFSRVFKRIHGVAPGRINWSPS
jgi:AraC-like DNA-binding protein